MNQSPRISYVPPPYRPPSERTLKITRGVVYVIAFLTTVVLPLALVIGWLIK